MAQYIRPGAPALLAPNLAAQSYNWSHESAWTGNNWSIGAGTPARDATVAFLGSWSAKLTGAVSQTMLNRFAYDAAILGTIDSAPYSAGCWVFPTAFTGAAYAALQINQNTSADANIIQTIGNFALSTLTLNAWNFISMDIPAMSVADQANWAKVDMRVSLEPSGGSGTFWADAHHFGRIVNGRTFGPNGGAISAITPYKIRKKVVTDYEKTQYGIFSARRYNTGFKTGELDTTPFRDTQRIAWSNFTDHIMDSTFFSLFYNQNDAVTNAYLKCALGQDDDGLEQISGTPNWKAKIKWIEAIT